MTRKPATMTAYRFPQAAHFGRRLSKEKIYLHVKPGHKQRQLFIRQVDKMQWQYKLAPETINLRADKQVLEIQVIDIWLKTGETELDEAILRLIDKAIPHPVYYRIYTQQKVQFAMPWKRPHEANKNQWVVEDYFRSQWSTIQVVEKQLQALPVVTHMATLYDAMLSTLLEIEARPAETLQQQLERLISIRGTQRQLQQLEGQLKREKQFNRKVEINTVLRQLKGELVLLTGPGA